MMKFAMFIFGSCLFVNQVFAKKIEETPLGKKAALIAAEGRGASLEGLSPEEKTAVLEILRGIFDGTITNIGNISPSQIGARTALVTLNDEPTIQTMIQYYQQYDHRAAWEYIPDTFEWAANPNVIRYLAPDFQLNDDLNAFYGKKGGGDEFDLMAPPRSIYSAMISLRIIVRSSRFSPELKAWAKEAQNFRFQHPETFRRLMRRWWEQNREAFEKMQYIAVQPIALTLEEEKPLASPSPPAQKPASARPAAEIPVSKTTVTPHPSAPPAPPSSPVDWALLGGIAVSALLAGASIWKCLKK
jgi:hypothetical protein